MKKRMEKLIKIMSVCAFICFAFVAMANAAIDIECSSSEEGLALKYKIPIIGRNNIELNESGDTDTIIIRTMLIKVVEIELMLNEITEDPGAVNLHYVIKIPFEIPGQRMGSKETVVSEGDVSVPFGSFGAEIILNGKKKIAMGSHNIEASLLLEKNRTEYDARIDYELDAELLDVPSEIEIPVFILDQEWSGIATASDNEIHEQVMNPLDDSVFMDIYAEVEYPSPFLTLINYKTDSSLSPTEKSVESEFQTITLPNGSYHIWFSLE